MNTLIKNEIISQAIELGFDFELFSDDTELNQVSQSMLDFFNENSEKLPAIEDECEVSSDGRSQSVSYGDYTSSGEIVDFSKNWHRSPETKVFHTAFVMESEGIMKNVRLYYLVGETDYNAPDGFYYDRKTKKHVAVPIEAIP
jgi:hypothetical protein